MNAVQMKLNKLCKDSNVKVLYVFGSRASETMELLRGMINSFSKGTSDLDIAILTDSLFSVDEKVKFTIQLEEIFEADEYELFVLRRAGDLAGFERERIAMVLQDTK